MFLQNNNNSSSSSNSNKHMQFLCSRLQALKVTVSILPTARTRRQRSAVHTCICRMCLSESSCFLLPKFSRRDATFATVRPGMYYTRYFQANHIRKAENSGLKMCSVTQLGQCCTRGPLQTANGRPAADSRLAVHPFDCKSCVISLCQCFQNFPGELSERPAVRSSKATEL